MKPHVDVVMFGEGTPPLVFVGGKEKEHITKIDIWRDIHEERLNPDDPDFSSQYKKYIAGTEHYVRITRWIGLSIYIGDADIEVHYV